MTNNDGEVRLFVSHHSSKREVAEHIERELQRRGIKCWMAPRDVEPGEPFDKAVRNAIGNSTAILLLFCGNSEKSRHVKRELILADSEGLPIIPLRLEAIDPGDLSYFLADSQWIDWIEKRDAVIDRVAAQARHYAGLPAATHETAPAQSAPAPAAAAAPPVDVPPPPVPQALPPEPTYEPVQEEAGGSRKGLWIGLAVAAVLAVVIGWMAVSGGDGEEPALASESDAPAEEEVATTEVTGGQTEAPAAPAAAAAPTYQTSFNCAAASTYVEHTICGSAELAALERRMAGLYRDVRQTYEQNGMDAGLVVEDQRAWLGNMRQCQDEACISAALNQRFEDLQSMMASGG